MQKIKGQPPSVIQVNLRLPAPLHRRLRAKAALEGIPVTRLYKAALKGYLNRHKKRRRRKEKSSGKAQDIALEALTATK